MGDRQRPDFTGFMLARFQRDIQSGGRPYRSLNLLPTDLARRSLLMLAEGILICPNYASPSCASSFLNIPRPFSECSPFFRIKHNMRRFEMNHRSVGKLESGMKPSQINVSVYLICPFQIGHEQQKQPGAPVRVFAGSVHKPHPGGSLSAASLG